MDAANVVDQMLAAGLDCPPQPLDVDGRLRRFGAKKNSWYRLREMRLDNGRYVVVGSFGCWKLGISERVSIDWAGISAEERAAMEDRQRAASEARRVERELEAKRAAMSALDLWRQGETQGASEYLTRKGIDGEGCRYLGDGSIIVPLLRYDFPREQALRAVQRIWPDGRKRFTRGFEKPGACLRLGTIAEATEPVIVCEGYATAVSLRMATNRRVAVFVAIDAGNLIHVVQLVREIWPASPILIAADDDWQTRGPDGQLSNTGRIKAWDAARQVRDRIHVVHPVWPADQRSERDTDYNDLHMSAGLGVVRRQVEWVLQVLGMRHAA